MSQIILSPLETIRKEFLDKNKSLKFDGQKFIKKNDIFKTKRSYNGEWFNYLLSATNMLDKSLQDYCLKEYNIWLKRNNKAPCYRPWFEVVFEGREVECILMYITYHMPIFSYNFSKPNVENYYEACIEWYDNSKADFQERISYIDSHIEKAQKKYQKILTPKLNKKIKSKKNEPVTIDCVNCKGITENIDDLICLECSELSSQRSSTGQ